MIAAYIIATVSCVEVLGPNVLAIFGFSATDTWGNVGIATGLGLLMLVIAVIGIRLTARTQVGMAFIEYAILIGMAADGPVLVLQHHSGTMHITGGWYSLKGIGGKGSLSLGFLTSVFLFTGWDGTVYVNEEVVHRRKNPGRAAVTAVVLLTVIYTFSAVGLQGVVSPGKLQANSASVLVYIATTLAGFVLTARIVYGMASYRVLPEFLGSVSPRFRTPVPATIVVGLLTIALTWVYLLATSVQNAFSDVVDVSGLLFALFYILTALATIAYFRRRLTRAKDLILLGILPLAAAAFLGWVVVKSMTTEAASLNWSVAGVGIVGVILLLIARFVFRSAFFGVPREREVTPPQGS